GEVFTTLKLALPYLFRYERLPQDVADIALTVEDANPTARSIMESALDVLPSGWQATDLHSRLILYNETKNYKHGQIVGRSP
ncbi:MAG: hypothetical protein ACWA5A_17705, partial [Marinibacterium sp.]